MFAAAAIAAGVAVADVTSANIVGYQNKTPDTSFKFVGPNFIQCDGTEDLTLGDLKFNCDETNAYPEKGWMPMVDLVNVLDQDGNCPEQLVYVNQAS